jgi:hypothetical protein
MREIVWMVEEVLDTDREYGPEEHRGHLETIATLWTRADPDGADEAVLAVVQARLTALADRFEAESDLPGYEIAAEIAAALAARPDDAVTVADDTQADDPEGTS